MMQAESQAPALNTTSDAMLKPGQPEYQMNSQGERIEVSQQQAPQETVKESLHALGDTFEDVISLSDTELAPAVDGLYPPTDDTGMEHKIISWGHVLKSTHDLARWSEKTGARRVNPQESIDAVSDLAINLEPRRNDNNNNKNTNNSDGNNVEGIRGLFNEAGGRRGRGGRGGRGRRTWNKGGQWQPVEGQEQLKSEVINCWPVLKSTHDQAQLSEKRGRNAVNQASASGTLEELALNQQGGNQQGSEPSQIVNSWPVLKSTHDQAQWSEKRGAHAVNKAVGSEMLEELAANGGTNAGVNESSLESLGEIFGKSDDLLAGGDKGTQGPSEIVHAWPVLKSTHDNARWSEKSGSHAVNKDCGTQMIDELAEDTSNTIGGGAVQAGGSSLQSGLDTQAGTHVQMEGSQKLKETPEQVMESLHVHV